MPVKGEEMFVAGSFMITFSQLKSNKPNLVSEKIKDETYYRKWDMKNKLISHLALLCRSTGVLGVGESTYSQSSSTLRCRPPKFQNCWHCPRSLRTWTRGSSACTCRSSNWGSAPGRARRPGAGGRSPRYFLRRGRRSAASPWRERLPGVVGVGRFVPAASQPSRRALQRQKVQTCGARQELGGRRAQRAGAGVRGTPAAWPGRKRVPWARVGGVPGGACGASPSAVPTRSSDRSISQRGRTESMVSGFRRCRREEGRRVHSVQPPGGLDPSAVGAAAFVGLAALRDGTGRSAPSWSLEGRLIHAPWALWPGRLPALESVCGGEEFPAKLNLAPNFLPWLCGDDPDEALCQRWEVNRLEGSDLGVIAQGSNVQHHAEAWIHTLKAQSLCLCRVESVKLLGPKEAELITLDPLN